MNLVMEDGSRINVIDHGNRDWFLASLQCGIEFDGRGKGLLALQLKHFWGWCSVKIQSSGNRPEKCLHFRLAITVESVGLC